MWPFRPTCPVGPAEQEWIATSMEWMHAEFGARLVDRGPALPVREYFPPGYTGNDSDITKVFVSVCEQMEVSPERVDLVLLDEAVDPALFADVPVAWEDRTAAGHWRRRDGRTVVSVQRRQATNPVALVATMAHEIGHERLLGEQRIDPDRPDGEPLTDLFSVYTGFGIFAANAAFTFRTSGVGWSTTRLGYLTTPMYGHALACWALMRGETKPSWTQYLDTNPRTWMKQSIRYLEHARRSSDHD